MLLPSLHFLNHTLFQELLRARLSLLKLEDQLFLFYSSTFFICRPMVMRDYVQTEKRSIVIQCLKAKNFKLPASKPFSDRCHKFKCFLSPFQLDIGRQLLRRTLFLDQGIPIHLVAEVSELSVCQRLRPNVCTHFFRLT